MRATRPPSNAPCSQVAAGVAQRVHIGPGHPDLAHEQDLVDDLRCVNQLAAAKQTPDLGPDLGQPLSCRPYQFR